MSSLRNLLEEYLVEGASGRHVLITIGKGGVGKTTFSILAGLIYSRHGKTLIASLDPAKHLLEYLGLNKPLSVERIEGDLYAVQYDIAPLAKKLSDEYALLLRQVMPGLTIVNLDDVVKAVKMAPGFEEEVFLRILEELYNSDYDYIVIDTPPTGVTHRILNLPRLHMFWIEKLHELRARIVSLRYAMARAMGRKVELKDPVLAKLQELYDRYKGLWKQMTDSQRTTTAIIATPEPLPVYEAKTTIDLLRQLNIKCRMLVVNRVLPEDKAREIGLLEVQRKSIEEALEITSGECRVIGIMQHVKTPKTLEEARELLDRVITPVTV
ncbi:MAG: ArsA family ATPase [Desulfurococcales archaeon]|nr:ArsA family ATPase [Desulfurococcales archaeon]